MADGAVVAGGMHFPITGDMEGFRRALEQAQKAQADAARAMTEQFQAVTEKQTSLIDKVIAKTKELAFALATTTATAVGEVAKNFEGMREAGERSVEVSFNSIRKHVDGFVNTYASKAGALGRGFAALWNAGIGDGIFAGLESLKPKIAAKIDEVLGSQALQRVGEKASQTWSRILGGAQQGLRAAAGFMGIDPQALAQSESLIGRWADAILKKVNELWQGVRDALRKLAGTFTGINDDVREALDKLDDTLDRSDFLNEIAGMSRGEQAGEKAVFEFLKGLKKSIEDLTPAEAAELEVRRQRAIAIENTRIAIDRDRVETDRYRSSVTAVTSALERQLAMERLQAETPGLSASERARRRFLAQAGSFGSGGRDLTEDPAVQEAARRAGQEGADIARERVGFQTAETVRRQTEALLLQQRQIGVNAGEVARLTFVSERLNEAHREGVRVTPELREHFEAMGRELGRLADRNDRARLMFSSGQDARRQIDALRLEAEQLGATAGEVSRLAFLHERLGEAQRLNLTVSPQMRAQFELMAVAVGQVAEQVTRAKEAFALMQDIGRTVSSSLERAFDSFMSGTKFKFKEFVNGLAQDLAKLAFRQSMVGIFGGTQSNPLGMFGNAMMSMFGGFRAEGGPVASNTAYVVGEKGPELFVPRNAGTIMPNAAMGGGPTNINMRIDLAGANGDDTIVRISRQAAAQAAQQAIEASNAAFPARQRRLQLLGA